MVALSRSLRGKKLTHTDSKEISRTDFFHKQRNCLSVVVIHSSSCVWFLVNPWTEQRQAVLSLTLYQSLPKFMSNEAVIPSNHLTLCHPLLLLPSIFPSIRVFSSEPALLIRWPEYLSFSFSISPSKEYSGLISFKMDWFDFFAFQGTLRSLLQHHSTKASILQHSAFSIVQLSHLYMTTGKTIALIIQTFVGKVMFLLFNTLCTFFIAFQPKSNCHNGVLIQLLTELCENQTSEWIHKCLRNVGYCQRCSYDRSGSTCRVLPARVSLAAGGLPPARLHPTSPWAQLNLKTMNQPQLSVFSPWQSGDRKEKRGRSNYFLQGEWNLIWRRAPCRETAVQAVIHDLSVFTRLRNCCWRF